MRCILAMLISGLIFQYTALGNTVKQELEPFSVIRVSGTAGVIIEQADSWSICFSGNKIESARIEVPVKNDTLVVSINNRLLLPGSVEKVIITAPDLRGIVLDGAGRVVNKATLFLDTLEVELNGNGKIYLKCAAKAVKARSSGTGKIILAGKSVTNDMYMSGAGLIEGSLFETVRSSVFVEGTGTCTIAVAKELEVTIYGTGCVSYVGDPVIKKKIFGLGSVERAYN